MATLILICPNCAIQQPLSASRCLCGASLLGIDPVWSNESSKHSSSPDNVVSVAPIAPAPTKNLCPHADCQQENPEGAIHCVYCNRSLFAPSPENDLPPPSEQGLISLPDNLACQYQVIKLFPSKGGEAELMLVALAEQPKNEREWRIAKIYRHGILPKPEVQERIAKIPAEYIVRMYQRGVSNGHAYELLEYLPLGSLRDYLNHENLHQLPEHLIIVLLNEINAALHNIHALGLIHRDLKPENLLVRSPMPKSPAQTHWDVVFTDFGIASICEFSQRYTSMAHSFMYTAPESIGGVVTPKTDYWALGIMVLEWLSGRHPFSGLSEPVILHQLITRAIDLQEVRAPRWQKILRGLLQRDPKQRWGYAEVLRWLAEDPSLPLPAYGKTHAAIDVFRLGADECDNEEQLAMAMSKNWSMAQDDINNGLLQDWLFRVLKNTEAARLAGNLRLDKNLSVDSKIVRLMLHLAPGIPPVFSGRAIHRRALMNVVAKAIKHDESAKFFLHRLYDEQILLCFAKAGNRELAELSERWSMDLKQFDLAWERLRQRIAELNCSETTVVEKLYDQENILSSNLPLIEVHPIVLAFIFDESWSKQLADYLQVQFLHLLPYCPWLGQLDSIDQCDKPTLQAIYLAMPALRVLAQTEKETQIHLQNIAESEALSTSADLEKVLSEIFEAGNELRKGTLQPTSFLNMHDVIGRYRALVLRARAFPDSGQYAVALKSRIAQYFRVVEKLEIATLNLEVFIERFRGFNKIAWILGYFLMGAFLLSSIFSFSFFNRLTLTILAILVVYSVYTSIKLRNLRQFFIKRMRLLEAIPRR